MLKVRVFAEKSLQGVMSSELVRLLPDSDVWVTLIDFFSDVEEFFSNEKYNEYDRVYMIGEVSDEFTNSYINDLEMLGVELYGYNALPNAAEGYDWISDNDNYFEEVLKSMGVLRNNIGLKNIQKALSDINGKNGAKLTRLWDAMDPPSFAAWIQDRLVAVSKGGKLFDETFGIASDLLESYYQKISKQMIDTPIVLGDTALFVIPELKSGLITSAAAIYEDKQKLVFVSLLDDQLILLERDETKSDIVVKNRGYRIGKGSVAEVADVI